MGPTASGKSDLAVAIAKKFSGKGGSEIISADSRQIYKGLDIGTGKVPHERHVTSDKKQEYFYKGIRHNLLDVANPKQTFTVAQYQKLARAAMEDIWRRGKLPILCGGTGLYIDAVVNGIVIPEVKPNKNLRKKLERKTTKELFTILQKLDAKRAANIDKQNPRRLIRAIEIAKSLGKVPTLKTKPLKAHVIKIGIKKDNAVLKKSIEKRLFRRLGDGMIEEVKKLQRDGLPWQRLEDLGLEYRYVSRFLRDQARIDAKLTLSNTEKKRLAQTLKQEMIATLKKEIWHYAKRQITWFKKDKNIIWVKNKKEALLLLHPHKMS